MNLMQEYNRLCSKLKRLMGNEKFFDFIVRLNRKINFSNNSGRITAIKILKREIEKRKISN